MIGRIEGRQERMIRMFELKQVNYKEVRKVDRNRRKADSRDIIEKFLESGFDCAEVTEDERSVNSLHSSLFRYAKNHSEYNVLVFRERGRVYIKRKDGLFSDGNDK